MKNITYLIFILFLLSCKKDRSIIEKNLYFSKIENIILLALEDDNFDINVFNYINNYEVKLLSIEHSDSFIIVYPEFNEICFLHEKKFHYFLPKKDFILFNSINIEKPEYSIEQSSK